MQIGGYLTAQLAAAVNMDDYAKHPDPEQVKKAFLTRALGALAVSQLTDAPMEDLCLCITDGSKDGGIDLIFFDPKEQTLYLVQTKWHADGHGSIELGDALKFLDGVRKVLDNDIDQLNERIKARRLDIERAIFDANAKFVLVLAHTGQEMLGAEVEAAIKAYVDSQNDTSELMSVRILKQGDLHKAVAAGVAGAPISVEVQLTSWGQIRDPHYAIYGQVCAADVAVEQSAALPGWKHGKPRHRRYPNRASRRVLVLQQWDHGCCHRSCQEAHRWQLHGVWHLRVWWILRRQWCPDRWLNPRRRKTKSGSRS